MNQKKINKKIWRYLEINDVVLTGSAYRWMRTGREMIKERNPAIDCVAIRASVMLWKCLVTACALVSTSSILVQVNSTQQRICDDLCNITEKNKTWKTEKKVQNSFFKLFYLT